MEGLGSGAGSSGLGFTVLLGLWSLGTPCGLRVLRFGVLAFGPRMPGHFIIEMRLESDGSTSSPLHALEF